MDTTQDMTVPHYIPEENMETSISYTTIIKH